MRGRTALAIVLALASACRGREGTGARTPVRARPARPGNGLGVLLITIDTLRADHLGAYGYGRATSPHIDARHEMSVLRQPSLPA